MNDLEFTKEGFESKLVGARLVVWFKALAVDILTDLETSSEFQNLLEAASQANDVDGYVQIKDSVWDSHADLMKLSKFITDDNELYAARGRVLGYHHEVLMARFRNTLGYCLLALRNFGKPMVAGLQGRVSAEYLGLTLLFDLRIATPDTTISFDNVRTGIPSSPAITLLMPGYIGTGKTLALANLGEEITAQEALELGLISRIIEQPGDLKEACIDGIDGLAVNHPDIVEFNRQHILPSGKDISAALKIYYASISKTLIRRNTNKG